MPATRPIRLVIVMTLLVMASFSRADVLGDLLSPDSATPAPTAQDKIEVGRDAGSDAEIRKRLMGIFC